MTSATATLKICIQASGLASIIPTLSESMKNQSKSLRIAAIESLMLVMQNNSVERLDHYVEPIEVTIKDSVVDPTPEVREFTRTIFESYKTMFPTRLERYLD